jgi:uracil-DNA glycosylase
VQLFNQLHPEWKEALVAYRSLIDEIDLFLQSRDICPSYDQIFRALANPISHTKVVIFGQDPYPTRGHAHGLAFSVDSLVNPKPASLRNILQELKDDVGVSRTNGDLSDWADQGVMLLNRVLSTDSGKSMAHKKVGWQQITDAVASTLGSRGVIALLWGKSAFELRNRFHEDSVLTSAHPSPLSAYKGFFGTKPFSEVNAKLLSRTLPTISW